MLNYWKKKKLLYWRILRPFFHFLFIIGVFFVIYKIRIYTDLIPFVHITIPPIDFEETFFFSLLAWVVFVFCWFLFWLYEIFKPLHWYYRNFLKTRLVWFIVISFLAYFGYWYIFQSGISRLILFWSSLWSWFVITLLDLFWNYINSILESKDPYRLLFVYSDKNFYKKIYANFFFYKIYDINSQNVDQFKENVFGEIKDYDIIVFVGNFDVDFLQEVSDKIRLNDKKFYHISESYFLEDLVYSMERIGPILAFEYKSSPLDWRFRIWKRIFDVLFSLLFLFIFSWLYVLVIFFILLFDWKPVFYKSKRVGRGKKEFWMYKFRTMEKDADRKKKLLKSKNQRKGPLFKIWNDPRILRWWKIFRKTSIDEMPQILNVLKWDMSVVWPRPHLPEEVENYAWWHKRLFSIKPGVTGYAQIFGRDKLDFDEEAKLDLYYIQNWNIWLDIYVILTTIKVLFKWS